MRPTPKYPWPPEPPALLAPPDGITWCYCYEFTKESFYMRCSRGHSFRLRAPGLAWREALTLAKSWRRKAGGIKRECPCCLHEATHESSVTDELISLFEGGPSPGPSTDPSTNG